MPAQNKAIKNYRIQIYFDCICGITCSMLGFTGIFIIVQKEGIQYLISFTVGISFLILYFTTSLFLIGLGIYTYFREKFRNPNAIPKKKVKAPIV